MATDVVVFIYLLADVLRKWVNLRRVIYYLSTEGTGRTRFTHCKAGQQAVSLAQTFPQLVHGFAPLLLGYTSDPVSPGFEVGGFALE